MTRMRRAERLLDQQLPGAAAGLARSVHAGATLLGAIEEFGSVSAQPISFDLATIAASVRRGGGPRRR